MSTTELRKDVAILRDEDNSTEIERKIFVGGLRWKTSEATLFDYFSSIGNVEKVNIMKEKGTKKPRGFAFVTFESKKSVESALLQSHHLIDGRVIEIKKAIPKSNSRRLFVGGIHSEVDNAELKEYFSTFGPVRYVQILKTKSSKSRCFGFIKFESEETASLVLSHTHSIRDKVMEVKVAEPKKEKQMYPQMYPFPVPHYIVAPYQDHFYFVNSPFYSNSFQVNPQHLPYNVNTVTKPFKGLRI